MDTSTILLPALGIQYVKDRNMRRGLETEEINKQGGG